MITETRIIVDHDTVTSLNASERSAVEAAANLVKTRSLMLGHSRHAMLAESLLITAGLLPE